MTTYSEQSSITLLTGASDPDGDPITVRRVNGTLITTWPLIVDLPTHLVRIFEDGTVTYDDEGNTAGHPSSGQTQGNGSFTFTLWDGADESPVYTATIELEGATAANNAPTGQNVTLSYLV